MSARQRLEAKRTALESELSDVADGAGLLGIFLGLFILVLSYLCLVMLLGIEDQLEHGFLFGVHVTVLCVLVLAGMLAPVFLVRHWLTLGYRKRYRHVWRWLKYTDAPKFVADQELWGEVFEILNRRPFLKLTGLRLPHSLDEQIELASDYWPVIEAMVRHNRRRLAWRVTWGSLARLSDTAAVFCFNGCMIWVLLLLTSFLLFLPLLPLYLVVLPLYVNRQGAQQALVDWFSNKPREWLGVLAPLPQEQPSQRACKR